MQLLFKGYVQAEKTENMIEQQVENDLESNDIGEQSIEYGDWQNGVLVLISVRLGIKKIPEEYFPAVREFFMNPLNVGIIGG